MDKKKSNPTTLYVFIGMISALGLAVFSFIGIKMYEYYSIQKKAKNEQVMDEIIDVLGTTSELTPTPALFDFAKNIFKAKPSPTIRTVQSVSDTMLFPSAIPTDMPAPTANPTKTYSATITDYKSEIFDTDINTFSWIVNGTYTTIPKTTVYYGTSSLPGSLHENTAPEQTPYSQYLPDFFNGEYQIPLTFVGSTPLLPPNTYYFRAYAYINQKHYWSNEYSFVVKKFPRHEAIIVDGPSDMPAGNKATFTWEINGPSATINSSEILYTFSSIVGDIKENVPPENTPYQILINDFTTGPYTVPLRFVGNITIGIKGTFYYRAHSLINGKHIWSKQHSFTVY